MKYDKNFIDRCEELFDKIKQNRPLKECLNTATSTTMATEIIWFVYYMFFAIHNPKMEDYIQKKTSTQEPSSFADIIKNMIKRRHYTSTIVFQLYTYAYTNNGNVTHIYPNYNDKDKNKYTHRALELIKSHQFNHLKTTVVHIRRVFTPATDTADTADIIAFLEYAITTAPTASMLSNATAVINKINNHIHYKRKDIIIIALACHMKIYEEDINTKNIFITATPEELTKTARTVVPIASTEPEIPSSTSTNYDEKYKYLYI